MSVARVLVAAFVAAFVLGFGYGTVAGAPWRDSGELAAPASAGVVPSSTSTSLATTTTTLATTTTTAPPPGGRVPTIEDPLRVVLAGDSVMAGLYPPVKAALEENGAAQVRFVLTPSILRDPTIRFTWEQSLEEFDPEVIVMFVGTWESHQVETSTGQTLSRSDPGWKASYEAEILDPWIQLITARGARVIWIGSPIVANPDAQSLFTQLNDVFEDLPTRFPNVEYLDSIPSLQGPDAGFSAVIPGEDGQPVRARQVDGLHLCPDGAALLAKPLLEDLIADWRVPVAFGWQGLPWRSDARVYPAAGCPAP